MTRVAGLVFLAFLSITAAFSAQPSKNKTVHKGQATQAHPAKSTASAHAAAHHSGLPPAKVQAKSGTQLRRVSAHGTSLQATHGKAVNSKWRGRYAVRRTVVPSYQTHPDEERYRQIQQALADRGYFKGEVNGQWEQDSVDALQKFQLDNKLPDIYTDGKINSLSLIGLGLGPKHGDRAEESVPTPPAPPPPATLAPAESSSSTVSSLPSSQPK